MASASSLRPCEQATQSCSGGRRMAPAATSGSSTRAKDLLNLRADGWSADGKQLLFTEVSSRQSERDRADRHRAPVRREDAGEERLLQRRTRPCLQTDAGWPTSRTCPVEPRSYIERYPELGNRQPISTGGGRLPLWSRDGQELFFSSPDGRQMFAVAVQSGTTLVAGRPQVLFEFPMLPIVGSSRPYDIAPDGRFLIIRSGQAGRQRRPGDAADRAGAELVRGAEVESANEVANRIH